MYIFNQERKRLEPTETKCQYCEVEHSISMGHNHFITLYKESDRTNIIVYRSVKFQKVPVGIPRCKSCLLIHLDAETKGTRIALGVAVSVIVLSFVIWGWFGIFSIFAGILILFGGAQLIQNKLVRDKGIYTKLEGAKQNQAVQDLIINGWSFSQPTA